MNKDDKKTQNLPPDSEIRVDFTEPPTPDAVEDKIFELVRYTVDWVTECGDLSFYEFEKKIINSVCPVIHIPLISLSNTQCFSCQRFADVVEWGHEISVRYAYFPRLHTQFKQIFGGILGFSENSSGHLNANVRQYEGLLFF